MKKKKKKTKKRSMDGGKCLDLNFTCVVLTINCVFFIYHVEKRKSIEEEQPKLIIERKEKKGRKKDLKKQRKKFQARSINRYMVKYVI